jgi:hypothetical protein
MNLQEIIYDLILEAAMSNAVFTRLYDNWKTEKPNINRDDIQLIYDEFKRKQNGLLPNKAEVRSFLYRFDGNHGYPRFNPEFLKDITKYSYKQITSLLDEYKDSDLEQISDVVFSDKDTKPTTEKLNASKGLWEGQAFSIINIDGFRVYSIPDQATSIKFGYYGELINKKIRTAQGGGNTPWCVTRRPDMRIGENLWGSYRNDRTFYYVIDENKGENDKYYLGALQKTTQQEAASGYILTSVKNDGDTPMTWNDIVRIYPKIEPYKDLIVLKPYSTEELQEKNILGQITESLNSPYEFKRVERSLKKAYINNNGILKKPESWAHMDTGLRNLYIGTTNVNNVFEKFNSFEFIYEIRKVGNEYNALNNRMKTLGFDGISNIIDRLISTEFRTRRTSLNKPYLKIYQSKMNGKCGLYDTKKIDWVNYNGTSFLPEFTLDKSVDSFIDENGELFILEKYKNGGQSFICIVPNDPKYKGKGYFMSQQKFEELQNDIENKINLDISKGPKMGNVNPETDTDIDENKKEL